MNENTGCQKKTITRNSAIANPRKVPNPGSDPMYPAQIRLAGLELLPGLYNSSVLIDHGWSTASLFRMLVHDRGYFAMSWQWGLPLWIGSLFTVVLGLMRRKLPFSRFLAGGLFPIVASVVYFALVPFWEQHRLLFPVYYALWLGAAHALGRVLTL